MVPVADGVALLPAAIARAGGVVRAYGTPPSAEVIHGGAFLEQRAVNAELDAAQLRVQLRRARVDLEAASLRLDYVETNAKLDREHAEGSRVRLDLALRLLKSRISADNDLYGIIQMLESDAKLCPAKLRDHVCVRPLGHLDENGEPSCHEDVDGSLFIEIGVN